MLIYTLIEKTNSTITTDITIHLVNMVKTENEDYATKVIEQEEKIMLYIEQRNRYKFNKHLVK